MRTCIADTPSFRIRALLALCVLGLGAWPCAGDASEGPTPAAVASVFPLAEMASAVAGGRVDVTLLLPPGSDPHSWEPRPSDIIRVEKADAVLLIGGGMEDWVEDLVGAVGLHHTVILRASEGAPLILYGGEGGHRHAGEDHGANRHAGGGIDPHIWLDFQWDIRLVEKIAELFSSLDPKGKPIFMKNAKAYGARLRQLDSAYRETLGACAQKTLLVGGHAAFGYLARAYGLDQIALYGLSPDAGPTPKRMIELTNLARQKGVKTIFFDQTVSDRLARTLASEAGLKTLALSPGASLTREDFGRGTTFLELMYRNLASLAEGLGCPPPARPVP